MAMPGFTAAAAIYQTSGTYRHAGIVGSSIGSRVVAAKGTNGNPSCGPCFADSSRPDRGTFTGFTQTCCDANGEHCYTKSCTLTPPPPSGPTEAECYAVYTACMNGAAGLAPPFDLIVAGVCTSNRDNCLASIPDPPLPVTN